MSLITSAVTGLPLLSCSLANIWECLLYPHLPKMVFHTPLSFLGGSFLLEPLLEENLHLKVKKRLIEFFQLIKTNMCRIKFIAPNKLLMPDRCKANIARSTLGPL